MQCKYHPFDLTSKGFLKPTSNETPTSQSRAIVICCTNNLGGQEEEPQLRQAHRRNGVENASPKGISSLENYGRGGGNIFRFAKFCYYNLTVKVALVLSVLFTCELSQRAGLY